MTNTKWIGVGLLALGVLVIFFSLKKPTSSSKAAATAEMGYVEVFRGHALLFRGLEKTDISERATIFEQDRLETAFDAEALIELHSGMKARLMPNTSVTLLPVDNKTQIVIAQGDLTVEGASPVVQITREGQIFESADYQPKNRGIVIEVTPISGLPSIEDKPVTQKNNPDVKEPENSQTEEVDAKGSLTESYITSVLRSQRQNFFKCYSQLLQKNPNTKGRVAISFTIVESGKISQSNLLQSNFQEESFHRCLMQVLTRISFHPYHGKPITTVFPLKFE